MKKLKAILIISLSGLLLYFFLRPSNSRLRDDLNSKNYTTKIVEAAYKLGERQDKLAIRPLLMNILDPRLSTNLNFKGMSVCYCRLIALGKIFKVPPPIELDRFSVDTAAAKFYLDLAIKHKIVQNENEIELTYYK